MDRLVIRGGRRIEGSVQVCGAKNAALPQIAAALLSSEPLELGNVPEVTDVDTMLALMREFGVVATHGPGRTLVLDAGGARNAQAPYDLVRRMRASILVLAPLLARFGSARVSLPGGCAIGARPIDLHLKALEALGADVDMEGGYIHARTKGGGLRGGRIVLSSPSVGATETALMAAVLARGESEILNAARDPEICRPRALPGRDGSAHRGRRDASDSGAGRGCPAPRPPRSDHRPHRGRDLRHRRRDHRRSSRDPRRPSRAPRLGRRGAGKCRRSDLADRSGADGCALRPLAGRRRIDRTLSGLSHRPAGAVHGPDDHRIGRIGHSRDRVREPIHARARARAARRQHLAARLDGAGARRRSGCTARK